MLDGEAPEKLARLGKEELTGFILVGTYEAMHLFGGLILAALKKFQNSRRGCRKGGAFPPADNESHKRT